MAMKIIKKILLVLAVLVALLLIGSLFIPSRYHVERSVVMDAPPEAVFPFVNQVKQWPAWIAWTTAKDSTLVNTFSGPESGVGATMAWEGRKLGSGTFTITAADPKTGVTYDLSFDQGKYKSKGALTFAAEGNGTRVTWSDDGDVGMNPMGRYFSLMFDKMMGPDFEEGLNNLKKKAEESVK